MKVKRFEGLTVEECISRREIFDKDDADDVIGSLIVVVESGVLDKDPLHRFAVLEAIDTLSGLYQLATASSKHLEQERRAHAAK